MQRKLLRSNLQFCIKFDKLHLCLKSTKSGILCVCISVCIFVCVCLCINLFVLCTGPYLPDCICICRTRKDWRWVFLSVETHLIFSLTGCGNIPIQPHRMTHNPHWFSCLHLFWSVITDTSHHTNLFYGCWGTDWICHVLL